ncbi:Coenzyme F420 hydrogenase/dehydrogenase, beta subunit C-terminal domain [uncultured Bacteroides sp.]|uniref:Coenzyme F420 hydrogenase/dehydrogenase, beta subunit C-terminal domain n=1 Tax=uncultured Bacteroides sp. TaxID=162156 RepID=UPI002AAA68BF|nr:Coenzyme F420 hydrogenase/dehydrogenase, beta subunit C-terminal domain [uncultured Bacteroides sp.]
MRENQIDILNQVIEQELCTGCGLCTVQNSQPVFPMKWDKKGFLIPSLVGMKEIPDLCTKVCPFNPFPDKEVRTENELADLFLTNTPNDHPQIGHYFNTYAGYSDTYRLTSSSGGIAYLIANLLNEQVVDAVFVVKESSSQYAHYEYGIIHTIEEAVSASKTKYYPVTLADVMKELPNIKGKVAIVGVACFIKAIRLHQYYHPELKEKIAFLIGIICGGMKSRFFAEYLAGKAGVDTRQFFHPQFRIKNTSSAASDYSYACTDLKGESHNVRMYSVGDMWGTGMFKNNACDFCDDVTTELADISLGDAWMNPYKYKLDGKGTNVIVTRSKLAENIIQKGILSGDLKISPLSLDIFLASQQGRFNHRHKAMGYRIRKVKKKNILIPPKRYEKEKIPIEFQWVQNWRMKIRKQSLDAWNERISSNAFDLRLCNSLSWLR